MSDENAPVQEEIETTPEEEAEVKVYPPLSVAACYKASLEDSDG